MKSERISNTKKMIQETALDMFSKKGYSSVSIRDICKEVGIKESSLYYHFLNKQAIMDSLMAEAWEYIQERKDTFNKAFEQTKEISVEAMCSVAIGFFKFYFLDPLISRIISILTIERMAGSAASDKYDSLVFDMPLAQQTVVFKEMMERGFIKENNPALLAREYYAIIYLAFQKNCLGKEVTDEIKQTAIAEIIEGIRDIYEKMIS